MLSRREEEALIALAALARTRAYAPYSGYSVGVAVVADDDRTFFGCNVENASLGLTLCAERSAMASAIAGGARKFRALVLVSDGIVPGTPCGACLQWLAEFGEPDTVVVVAAVSGQVQRWRLKDLLKEPFRR